MASTCARISAGNPAKCGVITRTENSGANNSSRTFRPILPEGVVIKIFISAFLSSLMLRSAACFFDSTILRRTIRSTQDTLF